MSESEIALSAPSRPHAGRRLRRIPSAGDRLAGALLALGSAAALAPLILHHPLGSAIPFALLLLYGAVAAARPLAWPVLLPALLPVADLATWTGQIYFTESDALCLATVLSIGGRIALLPARDAAPDRNEFRLGPLALALIALLALSYGASAGRALTPLPEIDLNAFLGYASRFNALRLLKGFALALLLTACLRWTVREQGARALGALAAGCAAGLLVAALFATWERLAYPGLLDFSSDYRITGPFWEMHVGGAALDGFLALTLPFGLWWAWRARTAQHLMAALAYLALAAYAAFATFSRGLYAAVAAILLTFALSLHGRRSHSPGGEKGIAPLALAIGCGALAYAFLEVFRTSGYRGLAALAGFTVASYALGDVLRGMKAAGWAIGAAFGLLLAAFGFAAGDWLSKGSYVVYAAAFGMTLLTLAFGWSKASMDAVRPLLLAEYIWLGVAAVLVARHWGGGNATEPIALAAGFCALAALANAGRARAIWRVGYRSAIAAGSAVVVIGMLVVIAGNYYMGTRFASTGQDLESRVAHWSDGLSLVATPWDLAFGVGLGGYPDAYFWHVRDSKFPGTFRIGEDGGRRYLSLGGPRHTLGFGELFRVSQRIDHRAALPMRLAFSARARQDASFHFEVCQKHLLYTNNCAITTARVAGDGQWHTFVKPLNQGALPASPWYAPRLAFFSVSVESGGILADIGALRLVDSEGRDLLANGEFERGGERWFFTSDRHHLPWHAKNLWLHFLVEQGVFGVSAFVLLTCAALARLAFGRGHGHPLAAPLLAAIVGFLVVGLFDSLVDAPRLAVLFYLLCVVALGLRTRTPEGETMRVRSNQRGASDDAGVRRELTSST